MSQATAMWRKIKETVLGRPPALSPGELRKARPIRNASVQTTWLENDTALLETSTPRGGGRLERWLAGSAGKPIPRRFELEEVGAYVWSLCDGRHTFEAIATKLQNRFQMQRLEAEASLAAFMQLLGRRGLISLAGVAKVRR